MAVIFPFGEGKTEKIIFNFLAPRWFNGIQFKEFISVGGKNQFRETIRNTVEAEINAGKDEIRILAFRDLDNGEQIENVLRSFEGIVRTLLNQWNYRPRVQEVLKNTVYKWQWDANKEDGFAGLRFVLHIANHEETNQALTLRNQTADGYILKVALDDRVTGRFASQTKVNTSAEVLQDLVTKEIPAIVRSRRINFNEDKDYLSAYLTATRFWVVKRTEEEARLIRIILERAWCHNNSLFGQVFSTWKIAINETVR